MELHQKAYTINANRLYEPYFANDEIYYGTRGQAKQLALCDYDAAKTYLGDEITYMNIPIKRAPNSDKYMTENGEIKTLHAIKYDQDVKAYNSEIDQLVADNQDSSVYILKGGHYYRPNSSGYTGSTLEAGIYPIKRGAEIVRRCSLRDCMKLVVINTESHNNYINERIEDLKSRLI